MANPEHLAVLKEGVATWNDWRGLPNLYPDLTAADLAGADLEGIIVGKADLGGAVLSDAHLPHSDLGGTELVGAKLTRARLGGANLIRAHIDKADFEDADLSGATLGGAFCIGTKFTGANLSRTLIGGVDFSEADLTKCDLSRSIASATIFHQTVFDRTTLSQATFVNSFFSDVDLSGTVGLETCVHRGPSSIDFRTLARSQKIPLSFLRGCGLSDAFIDYLPSMLATPVQFYSCFISYSTHNQDFAERLHADLQDSGVRCWFAPDDLKIGDPFRQRIDESIRVHDKLLLILSESSVKSQWVQEEVETAFERERREKRLVLFPIRIDGSVMTTNEAWAAGIRRTRHIGDFGDWKQHDSYRKAIKRLLRDLNAQSGNVVGDSKAFNP
jgi:uncharacterized protein YjbI with pentapeptide repeats